MTVDEFKREFHLLYNNITSDMAPGLDDYEISLFLTEAQEKLVTQLYVGSASNGFEESEKVRRNLAYLIDKQKLTSPVDTHEDFAPFVLYDFALSSNLMYIISEQAVIVDSSCCNKHKRVNVLPIKYDELNKVVESPFRRPNNFKVLRIDKTTTSISILSKSSLVSYTYEYLRKPNPIILVNLPNGLTIDGMSTANTSELDESLHRTILDIAVQLAAASWASNNKN